MGYPYQSKRRNVLNNDYNKEQNDKNDDNKNNGNKGKNRNVMVLLVISVILTLLCWRAYDKITNGTKKEIPYSGFVEMLDSGEVDNAEIYAKKIRFTSKESDGTLDKNTYVTVRISWQTDLRQPMRSMPQHTRAKTRAVQPWSERYSHMWS